MQVKRFSFHFNRLCNQWIRYYYKHGDKVIRYEHGAVRNAVRNAWNRRHNYVMHLYRRNDQIWIQQNKCTSETRTIIYDKKTETTKLVLCYATSSDTASVFTPSNDQVSLLPRPSFAPRSNPVPIDFIAQAGCGFS